MARTLPILVLVYLGLAAVLSACSDGEAKVDLTPVADSIVLYPGARLHSGGVPPGGLRGGTRADYEYDRLYATFGTDAIPPEDMIAFFQQNLPQQGWKLEDPIGEPTSTQFSEYCQLSFIKCASFTKGNIRVIISSPIRFSLNPISNNSNSYHVHVETF